MKRLWQRIMKAFAIHNVRGSCECGKYRECCRKIHSNSYGKMWVETHEHLNCGKVQKQIRHERMVW